MTSKEQEAHQLCADSQEDSDFEPDDDDEDVVQGIQAFNTLKGIALSDDDSSKLLHDTPSDTWGVILYIIVKDVGDLTLGNITCAHIFRLIFGFVAMVGNLSMQVILLMYTFEYVVSPAVIKIQRNYQQFHAQCYDLDGAWNQTSWENFNPEVKHNLCHTGMAQTVFLACILFLWTLAMLQEFRENSRLHRHLNQIPNLPVGVGAADQVVESDSGDMTCYLVALSPATRCLVYALIIIPKYIIILVLFWIGLRWLSASESFSDLILNSLALEFIVTIDDLIFLSVFPEMMTERVTCLKLAVPSPKFEDEKEKEDAESRQTIVTYARSVLVLCIAISLLLLYMFVFQRVVPGAGYDSDLSKVCNIFINSADEPCQGLFGLSGAECFPYGGGGNNWTGGASGAGHGGHHGGHAKR